MKIDQTYKYEVARNLRDLADNIERHPERFQCKVGIGHENKMQTFSITIKWSVLNQEDTLKITKLEKHRLIRSKT